MSLQLPIVTERLLLRDFVAGDAPAVHTYASDPEVTRHMFYGPRDEAGSADYIQRMLESQRQTPRRVLELAILRRADERLIGACDLTLEQPQEGDLGYILARDAWGCGYATEAARAMVRVGFEQLSLERIIGICEVTHAASARILEKAGLRRTDLLRDFREAKGRSWDMLLYSLTRADWQGRRTA